MIDDARDESPSLQDHARGPEPTATEFETRFTEALPALITWARIRLRGRERLGIDLDDVLQETWLRAFEGFPRFDERRGKFRSWIISIAQHVLLESARRGLARGAGQPQTDKSSLLSNCPDSVTTLTRAVARDESLVRLLALVDELPSEERVLVVLRGLEERPFEEVATHLELSEDAAIKRWSRLCARLRETPAIAQLFD